MKKIIFFIIFLCFCLTISINIKANNDIYVMPGGESIGLKIETGVEIVGKYSFNECKKLTEIEFSESLLTVEYCLSNQKCLV